jgi:hypothetical protein
MAIAPDNVTALEKRTGAKIQQEPREPPKQPINWLAFEGKEPPPRVWWQQDWLSPAPTLVAGSGGVGKTTIVLTTMTAGVTCKPFLADSARDLRVLVWCCEETEDDLWRLQHSINRYLDVRMMDLQGRLHVVSRVGLDNELMGLAFGALTFTPVFEDLREQVNDLHIDICVLDNVAQVFGGNENDRHHVTRFVNGAAGLVTGRPFCPMFLGHTARAQGSEFSGSAAWENACRMRWYVGHSLPDQKPEEDEPGASEVVYVAKRKTNHTAKDWRRFKYQDGLFVPESTPEPGVRLDQGYRDETADEVVLAGMAKLKDMGITVTDGKTSPDFLPTQIIAKRLASNHTKKELAAAMNRLMTAGRLRRGQIGTYPNRSPRMGLVLV